MYQYRIHHSGAERLELRLGWPWRLFFLGCSGFLAWTAFDGGRIYPLPVLVGLICLVAGLYSEQWVFDRADRRIVSLIGLFPLLRQRVYELDRLEAVRVRTMHPIGAAPDSDTGNRFSQPAVPRALQRRLVRLSLRMRDENGDTHSINVQTESQRRYQHLLTVGQAVAEFCQVGLESPAE